VPHELVMESIRTFGEKVLPHFSADEAPRAQASAATTAA
jgi:hypothetical protein